jgi:adenosylcobinamide-GDP ribazoletransferase
MIRRIVPRRAVRGARQALSFLTSLGGAAPPTPAALVWFGPVGVLIGGSVGVTWWVAGRWWAPLVAAALAVVADIALTGALHLDGLADTADGLIAPMPAERRLEVLRDPRAGAFGVVAVAAALVVRVITFASVDPGWRTALAVAALWAVARTVMAVATLVLPYARAEGLASAFTGSGSTPWTVAPVAVAGALPAVVLGALAPGPVVRGVGAVLVAALAGAAVLALARRRIGGFTGDVLGAAGVVAETAGLLVLAVQP